MLYGIYLSGKIKELINKSRLEIYKKVDKDTNLTAYTISMGEFRIIVDETFFNKCDIEDILIYKFITNFLELDSNYIILKRGDLLKLYDLVYRIDDFNLREELNKFLEDIC